MPRKRKAPEALPVPERATPLPKRCPRCRSRKIIDLGVTPGGVYPWRCRACLAIGYDDRIVGEPAVAVQRAPRGRPRREELTRRFIRRPRATHPEDSL